MESSERKIFRETKGERVISFILILDNSSAYIERSEIRLCQDNAHLNNCSIDWHKIHRNNDRNKFAASMILRGMNFLGYSDENETKRIAYSSNFHIGIYCLFIVIKSLILLSIFKCVSLKIENSSLSKRSHANRLIWRFFWNKNDEKLFIEMIQF